MKKVLYKLFTCLSTTRSKQGVLCPRRCNIRFCFLLPCQESSRATYHPLGHDDLAMRTTSTAADRRLPQISQGCLATCRQLLRPRKICSVIHQRVLRLCKNIRQPIADYSSFMRVLGDPQAITSTSLRIVDMSSTTWTIWLGLWVNLSETWGVYEKRYEMSWTVGWFSLNIRVFAKKFMICTKKKATWLASLAIFWSVNSSKRRLVLFSSSRSLLSHILRTQSHRGKALSLHRMHSIFLQFYFSCILSKNILDISRSFCKTKEMEGFPNKLI